MNEPLRELLLDIIDRFAVRFGNPKPSDVQAVCKEVRRIWAGQTVYIPRRGETEQTEVLMRNKRIMADHKRGEHAELLSRRYGITARRVRQIIAEQQAGNDLP